MAERMSWRRSSRGREWRDGDRHTCAGGKGETPDDRSQCFFCVVADHHKKQVLTLSGRAKQKAGRRTRTKKGERKRNNSKRNERWRKERRLESQARILQGMLLIRQSPAMREVGDGYEDSE